VQEEENYFALAEGEPQYHRRRVGAAAEIKLILLMVVGVLPAP
jgi:hypothetical protein